MYDRRIVRGNTYAQNVLPVVTFYISYKFKNKTFLNITVFAF